MDGDKVALAVSARPDDVADVLSELASVLVGQESVDTTLRRVADLAARTVPGCSAAGITLLLDETPRTAAYTDQRTLAVDRQQYDLGEGPCLEAIRTGASQLVDVEEARERWPGFTEAAIAAGVRSFLAAPLPVGESFIGALNLYSASRDGFDHLDEVFVTLLTEQAAVTVAAAERYNAARDLATQLEEAMRSRAVIEQAKGVLMARHRADEDRAFELLRRESQHRNVKLRTIAREIVDSTQDALPAPSAAD
jgi:transcriptional regulator with GAF, ATPase, and Fis domain